MLQKMGFVTFLSVSFQTCYLCSLLIRIPRIKVIDNHKCTTNRRFTYMSSKHFYAAVEMLLFVLLLLFSFVFFLNL